MANKQIPNRNEAEQDKQLTSRLQECPIAIVGMSSVFAETKNLDQFWDNIVESVNGIQDIPENRWAIDDYYSRDKKEVDKSYCKRGAFLPEIDFDPMEFGLPPNILELTDITQLMSLVVARDVLADAGYSDENSFDRDKMGIILGVGGGQKQGGQLMARLQTPILEKVLQASGINETDCSVIIDKFKKAYIPWEENSFPGLLGNVIAGRIANRFNFGGTNCVVDAACAGSLAAIKMAISDLLEYRSDMMISGGICCDNSPFMYLSFSKTPAFTDGDDIRPFDENSKGMMIGEGVGMIALKRLSDAERDGDKIYAVIKGIGSSSDGRFKSIYAPRPEGQLKALKRAYEDAGFDPKTCGLIEAHGTGTKAGDAAEFAGLNLLFNEFGEEKQHVALGSVKSQVGHTKAAAGTAGMIKAALALHHKVLPATINVDKPNPALEIENSALYINNETRPWMPRADGIKRRAGISSFGFGGTNFHFVLEEYKATHTEAYRLNNVSQTILISATDKQALLNSLQKIVTQLDVDADNQPYVFNALVLDHPLKTPANNLARCGFIAKNAEQAIQAITQIIKELNSNSATEWSKPTGLYYRETGLVTKGKVVALFSGQGSQYLNMGRDLTCNFPTMLASNAQMDREFSESGEVQLSTVTFPIPVFSTEERQLQENKLRLTQYAQPAIGTFSVGLFNTFKNAGFSADFAAGHSFGELTALWAADVLSEADYMLLARSRGQAMAAPEDKSFDCGTFDCGTMAAVVGSPADIEKQIKAFDGVTIANYNSNNQVVIAGKTDLLLSASEALQAQGYKVVPLPVSAAFHTDLVSHAQKPFADVIDGVEFNSPTIPVFANGTAQAHSDNGDEIKEQLKKHILQSVHFNEEIDNLYDAGGRIFIEFGPKNVLSRLVDNILMDKEDVVTIAINANPKKLADQQLRLSAVQMAVLGIQLDNIDPYCALQRPVLPSKSSPLAMKLSGASYVSEKTKQTFADALNDGFRVSTQSKVSSEPKVIEKIVEKEVIVEKIVEKIVYVQSDTAVENCTDVGSIESSINKFVDHQAQLLAVHEEYMQGPKQYADTFQEVLKTQAGATQLPESLDKTLAMYHDFQSETLRVHENYLNQQTNSMNKILGSVEIEAAKPVVSKPTLVNKPIIVSKGVATPVIQPQAIEEIIAKPVLEKTVNTQAVAQVDILEQVNSLEPVKSLDLNEIQTVMLSVVADKTGYPSEMLELSMDMEADLGIDSIKRVEILGAVQDEIADLPELNAEDLAELRTLGEIVNYMQSKAPDQTTETETVVTSSAPVDLDKIQNVMLSVVADKTGYPSEMLELSMDMEADLGIDSIKRVEILGAVQDEIADLPELNAEDLAELRTLGEIVNYMQSKAPAQTTETETVVTSSAPVDLDKIQNVMLSVVADKTGYPSEMLELSMDMEADLGIDSIKRVEILGAVQDEIADLPELNAEDLAELRTLGEIVSYMQSKAPVAPVVAEAVQTTSTPIDLNKIQTVMLTVVADKTGYPAEMLELGMDMEADLGIDSIKRVEILGAVQDEIADLPELNAEDLAELRTLGEIVSYMQSKAPVAAEAVQTTSTPIDLDKIQNVMLSVVADKTGYPAEMLELGMDMEADLGIDSIKRVEILGAVQDEIADLPELNAEDLAELRTLGEIVSYMQSKVPTVETKAESVVKKPEQLLPEQITIEKFEQAPSAVVKIKHLEAVISLEQQVNGENLLLVDDGEGVTPRLANKLSALGWSVTVLKPSWVNNHSSKTFADSVNKIALTELDETELTTVLATQSVWSAIIYLHPKNAISGFEYPQTSKDGLKLAFLLAKRSGLAQNSNNEARSSFVVLTRQGGDFGVESNEIESDLVQTGLAGLVKTLAQEWPSVFCRIIDVASKFGNDKAANLIISELSDRATKPVEVGFNNNGRLTLIAEKTESYNLSAGDSITQDSLFLVSGGAKGVTAHCVIRLAKTYQCKFILLGRSQYDALDPIWADSIKDETALKKAAMQFLISNGEKPTPMAITHFVKPVLANREIKETLKSITDAGGLAEYISADVTDSEAVLNTVSPITDLWGDITGIIHGAGVLADKLIEQKTLSDFEAVYRTKIDGLLSLFGCCDLDKIQHLVLFSSAAGFYGNSGQSDYSIANDILNKTAFRFKALNPNAQVLSFNWGPWDGGMVTSQLKEMFCKRGVYIIPLDSGAELLVSELGADTNRCPQILVGNDMTGLETESETESTVKKPLVSRLTKDLIATNNPFLADHQIGENQVLPTVCAIAWMVDATLSTYIGYVYTGLQNYKLLKGVIFDGSQPQQVAIDLNLLDQSGAEISVEVKISSQNRAGKTIYHYMAILNLSKTALVKSRFEDDLSELVLTKQATAIELYENGTLFHGESLQGIQAINECDENGLLLSCCIDNSVVNKQGEFNITKSNIFANDLLYQALLVWVRKQLGLGSLPTATVNWQVYQEIKTGQPFYLKLNVTENRKNKKISADVLFINSEKEILASAQGVQVTASASLNDLFKR